MESVGSIKFGSNSENGSKQKKSIATTLVKYLKFSSENSQ